MKAAELLRSSAFRLSFIYMILFAGSVLILLGFIYWSTVGYMSKQTDATIEAEITGLAVNSYRSLDLPIPASAIIESAWPRPVLARSNPS